MLTPLDIQNKTFDVKFRGYSTEEVDDFVDMVYTEFEKLYKENIVHKDKIETLCNAIEHYRQVEDTMKNAIMVAQGAAEDVRRSAKEQSEAILLETKSEQTKMINDAKFEVAQLERDYALLKQNIESFKIQIRGLFKTQIEILDSDKTYIENNEKTYSKVASEETDLSKEDNI